jgi:hypothetical protein
MEGARVLAGHGSGDGPQSVRVRPSSPKRGCDRRTTSTGGKCLVNVHAKSRLTPEPLRTLRPEAKGQARACPNRTRAIPCPVRVITKHGPTGLLVLGRLQSASCSAAWPLGHYPSVAAAAVWRRAWPSRGQRDTPERSLAQASRTVETHETGQVYSDSGA